MGNMFHLHTPHVQDKEIKKYGSKVMNGNQVMMSKY